jgi:hypothetical protein
LKKIDLGQTITILANIGVIAGIIFLAIELRQNNELMRAEARDAQNERIQDYVQQVYMVPGLAEIILKARNGEPLTEVEELKLLSRQGRRLRGFAAQWREYRVGTVENFDPVAGWRTFFYEGDYQSSTERCLGCGQDLTVAGIRPVL